VQVEYVTRILAAARAPGLPTQLLATVIISRDIPIPSRQILLYCRGLRYNLIKWRNIIGKNVCPELIAKQTYCMHTVKLTEAKFKSVLQSYTVKRPSSHPAHKSHVTLERVHADRVPDRAIFAFCEQYVTLSFYSVVCNTVKICFFICYLTIHLVTLGGFFPIGWDSKVYLLLACTDDGKGLFLWGMSLIFFLDYSVRKKSN